MPTALRWRENLVLTLILVVLLAPLHLFGEKIGSNDSFEGDSRLYGPWAKDFSDKVCWRKLDEYRIQRILPSAVVHYSLRLLGLPLTNRAIRDAFVVLNLLTAAATAYAWCVTAESLGLNLQGKCLGLVGLFGNFFALKWSSYHSILTDMPAYLTGMLTVCFFVRRSRLGLALTALVGAFVWPTAVALALPLLLFPRPLAGTAPFREAKRWPGAIGVVAAGTFLLYTINLLGHGYVIPFGAEQPLVPWLPLSFLIAALYLGLGLRSLLSADFLVLPSAWARSFDGPGALLAVAVFLVVRGLYALLSNGQHSYDLMHRLEFTVATGVAKPAAFFLANLVFYGPFFVLALILWPRVRRLIHGYGPGPTLCALLGLGLGLCSEPRSLLNLYPLLVLFVVLASITLSPRRGAVAALVIVALVSSKVWWPINSGTLTGYPSEFPHQTLSMSYGPYMTPESYWVQMAISLIAGGLLYVLWRPTRSAEPGTADTGVAQVDLPVPVSAIPTELEGKRT
jgi:hypothetical protein